MAGIFYLPRRSAATTPRHVPGRTLAYSDSTVLYKASATLNVIELKNVRQTPSPFVTTAAVQVNNDCAQSGFLNRAVTLTFPQAQAGSYGYAVVGARGSSGASLSSPGGMTELTIPTEQLGSGIFGRGGLRADQTGHTTAFCSGISTTAGTRPTSPWHCTASGIDGVEW